MYLLQRLTVGGKLAVAFTLAVALMVASGLLSVADLARMNDGLHSITEDSLPSIENAAKLSQEFTDYRRAEYRLIAEPAAPRDGSAVELEARRTGLAHDLDRARALASSSPERQAVAAVAAQWTAYAEVSRQVEIALRTDPPSATRLFSGPGRRSFDVLIRTAERIVAINEDDANAAEKRADTIYGKACTELLFVMAMAVLSVGAMGYFITRSITGPLRIAVSAARAISDDELALPPPRANKGDEIAQLTLALDHVSAHRGRSVSIAKMSHELRTPLNAIVGFAEVLLADQRNPLLPAQHRHIDQILRSGRQLIHLVEDLLDLSRIAAGFMMMRSEAVDVLATAREATLSLAPLAEEQGIQLSVTAPADATYHVQSDRMRLSQVMVNLVSNAIKYNRPGGRVLVALTRDVNCLHISVQDTGIGMSSEQLEGLFKPFDRLGRETTGIPGTGLGLVITNKLLTLMGATLAVRSAVDVGSEFIVRLAAPQSEMPDGPLESTVTTATATVTVPPSVSGRVLYIDDDEINRLVMQAYFSLRPQVHLALASDGPRGIQAAMAQPADVMLIDIMMPGMDGIAILKEVRSRPQLRDAKCIAVSANAMPNDVEDALAAGFDGYLTKPLSAAQLFGEVDKWLPQ